MTHSKVTLVILAAGMGSRYGSLKQIKGIGPCGEILLDYSVYDAIVTGFKKVIFVIQKETESFFYHRIKTMYPSHIEFHCVEQNTYNILEEFEINTKRKKPWGTGHALLTTASLIQEPCCVINADDFYGRKTFGLMYNFLVNVSNKKHKYCMVGFPLKNTLSKHGTVSRGICELKGNYLKQINEITKIAINTKLDNNLLVSMNFWGLTPSFFSILKQEFKTFLQAYYQNTTNEFFLPDVVNTAIKEHNASVKVFQSTESWFGMTYVEDHEQVKQQIFQKIKEEIYTAPLF